MRNMPKCFNAKELPPQTPGYSEANRYQENMYWNVFAGARRSDLLAGSFAVWQMYDLDKTPSKCFP